MGKRRVGSSRKVHLPDLLLCTHQFVYRKKITHELAVYRATYTHRLPVYTRKHLSAGKPAKNHGGALSD